MRQIEIALPKTLTLCLGLGLCGDSLLTASGDAIQALPKHRLSSFQPPKAEAAGDIGDRAARAIDSGEGPSPAIIALITPKSAQFAGRMAEIRSDFAVLTALETVNASIRDLLALWSAVAGLALATPAVAIEARYACSGGGKLSASFSPPDDAEGEVKLTFATGRELSLPQVLSADGGRYANAGIEFWIKGKTATLTMNGVQETCSTQ